MKKLAIVISLGFILILISTIINSCCDNNAGKIKYSSIECNNVFITNEIDNEISSELTNIDKFNYNQYGINIKFGADIIALYFNGASFIQESYAFTCDRYYNIKHRIKEFNIITLNKFDSSNLNNSLITEYFVPTLFTHTITTYDKLLKEEGDINYSIDQYRLHNINARVFLRNKPTLDSVFRFIVQVKLENNVILQDTTPQIIIR